MSVSMMIMIASNSSCGFRDPWMFTSEPVAWLALWKSHEVSRIDFWLVFLMNENFWRR